MNRTGKKITPQQKKDKSNIEREANIMRAQKKKTIPFKKYKSNAQRKAVHASKAEQNKK